VCSRLSPPTSKTTTGRLVDLKLSQICLLAAILPFHNTDHMMATSQFRSSLRWNFSPSSLKLSSSALNTGRELMLPLFSNTAILISMLPAPSSNNPTPTHWPGHPSWEVLDLLLHCCPVFSSCLSCGPCKVQVRC